MAPLRVMDPSLRVSVSYGNGAYVTSITRNVRVIDVIKKNSGQVKKNAPPPLGTHQSIQLAELDRLVHSQEWRRTIFRLRWLANIFVGRPRSNWRPLLIGPSGGPLLLYATRVARHGPQGVHPLTPLRVMNAASVLK